MGELTARSPEEREEICSEIERRIRALPDMNDKGKLQGLIVRLRNVRTDATRFEDEFRKLAALAQKIAREDPAGRLRDAVEQFAGSSITDAAVLGPFSDRAQPRLPERFTLPLKT